jgi:hypothetical protein
MAVAALAPAYLPRRPTETVLYGLVCQHLESFLAYAREHYRGGLPRYVEQELRAFLKCGLFSEGFVRCHCDSCGHDLLVAFSCHGRSICPSCCGRRMASGAAHLVDRVLPDVPVRQYVLSLPYELRRLAAFKAQALTAFARTFVEAIFVSYRARAKRSGIDGAECGSVLCVQRSGSLNLNVHFHVLVLDGVFSRDPHGSVGLGGFVLLRVMARTDQRWLGAVVVTMVILGDGVNAYQIHRTGSAVFIGPLSFVILTIAGVVLHTLGPEKSVPTE